MARNYSGMWIQYGNNHYININGYDFSHGGRYNMDNINKDGYTGVKVPGSPIGGGSCYSYAPVIKDVRHLGAIHAPHGYAGDTNDPDFYCDRNDSSKVGVMLPADSSGTRNIRCTQYDSHRNEPDSQEKVYTCQSITGIDPTGTDTKETISLYNYDSEPRIIHVAWTNEIWRSDTISPYDIIAVRARYSLNWGPDVNERRVIWSAWFHEFAPVSGRWNDGYGPRDIVLYGKKPPNPESHSYYGFNQFQFRDIFKDGIYYGDDGYKMNYIPPHYPYSITVQVQIASQVGVSAISQNVTGNIRLSTLNKTYKADRRRIYVAPRLTTDSILTKSTSYVDRISVYIEGPALPMDIDDIFTYVGEEVNGNTVGDDMKLWFATEDDPLPYNVFMYALKVYAKKKSQGKAKFINVYNWKAAPKDGANGYAKYHKRTSKTMNLAYQKSGDSDDNNAVNISENGTQRKQYFEPKQDAGEEYSLAIYCTVILNDSKNKYYDGRVDESPLLVGLRLENKYVFTLPKTILYTTNSSGTPYKYIHGLSVLYKDGAGWNKQDYFMTFRATKQFTLSEIENMINNDTWDQSTVKNQIKPVRLRLEVKKNGRPSFIISRYLNPNFERGENNGTAITNLHNQKWGFDDYNPMIRLTEDEWDRIYKLFPGNSSSTPNQVTATIQLFTIGSYENDGTFASQATTREIKTDSEFNSVISYPDTVKNITIQLTGIQKTAHLNDHKTAEDKAHRAYVWVNPLQSEGTALRAVTWVNPEEAEKDKYDRSI